MFDLELFLDSDEAFLCPDVGVSIDRLTLSPHALLPGGWQCSFYHFGEYIITIITTIITIIIIIIIISSIIIIIIIIINIILIIILAIIIILQGKCRAGWT